MDKNSLSAHKTRSMQAVMADGWRLYYQNFGILLRSSWIQAIIYSLVAGCSMTYFFTELLPLKLGDQSLMPALAIWAASLLLFILAVIVFAFAGGFAPLREHFQTDAMSKPRHWWGRWPWRLIGRGLTALPKMLVLCIRRHQLSKLIVVSLVMLLLVVVATAFFLMPAIILAVANIQGQADLAVGDAADLPEHLWLLNFATFTVCSFLQAYIHLATLFPLYYIWANAAKK
ncbi:MAG: hypothetical protein K5683_02300 [Prevotella sp.]|nr:hypothetical protein [Prevotella sp.]